MAPTDYAREIARLSPAQATLLGALLDDEASPGDLGDCGSSDAARLARPHVVCLQEGDGQPPLVVVHGSGGRVLFLHSLARGLPASRPVYGLEGVVGTGAMGEEDPPQAVCARYVEALRTIQPRGPYRLAAYSAGCILAFDMAGRLRSAGEEVAFLLFIDPPAPPGTDNDPASTGEEVGPHQRLRRRFDMAMLAGVTPLSSEFPYVAGISRGLSDVARDFTRAPLDIRLHLVHGLRGPHVTPPAALDRWAALAGRGMDVAATDADHFDIVREPRAAVTAWQIEAWLGALPHADRR